MRANSSILPPLFGTYARRTRWAPSARSENNGSTVTALGIALRHQKHRQRRQVFASFARGTEHSQRIRASRFLASAREVLARVSRPSFNFSFKHGVLPTGELTSSGFGNVRCSPCSPPSSITCCSDWHDAPPRFRPHVQRLRGERTPHAVCPSFNVLVCGGAFCRESLVSRFVASARNQGIVMLRQIPNATTRIAVRSKRQSCACPTPARS